MKKAMKIVILLLTCLLFSSKVFASDSFEVKPGDHFWRLHVEFGVDWHEIQKINWHLLRVKDNPGLIFPGQKFLLPDGYKTDHLRQGRVIIKDSSVKEVAAPNPQPLPTFIPAETKQEIHNPIPVSQPVSVQAKEKSYITKMSESLIDAGFAFIHAVEMLPVFFIMIIVLILAFLAGVLNFFPRCRKNFVGFNIDGFLCYVAYDERFKFIAHRRLTEGFDEIALIMLEKCGIETLTSTKFIIPHNFRGTYTAMNLEQISAFRSCIIKAEENRKTVGSNVVSEIGTS